MQTNTGFKELLNMMMKRRWWIDGEEECLKCGLIKN